MVEPGPTQFIIIIIIIIILKNKKIQIISKGYFKKICDFLAYFSNNFV